MPEFNQNFIKGRMSKDLDERLVPNGEYRDALNISVSTSEDADIGTVQTLKGNTLRGNSMSGFCVGSIADEKNNKIYYLVSGNKRDGVIEYDSELQTEQPVLIDIYEFNVTLSNDAFYNSVSTLFEYSIVDSSEVNIRTGMQVTGTLTNPLTGVTTTFTPGNPLLVSRIEVLTANTLAVYLEDENGNTVNTNIASSAGDTLTFTAERVLNFDEGSYITGINVIDDFLFFTDNRHEPKQISISRSIAGTPSVNQHTLLKVPDPLNPNSFINFNSSGQLGRDFVEEQHITVIKKSPLIPPTLEMSNTKQSRVNGIYAEAQFNFAGVDPNTGNTVNDSVGTQYTITFINNVTYVEGDVVICSNDDANEDQDSFATHEVRLKVIDAAGAPNTYVFELMSITTIDLSQNNEQWYFLLDQDRPLFEFKFPRFAYRYKYADGEYSSFSPFSEPAFLPSTFDYHPKKGFNLGMVNSLRFLKVKDFVLEKELIPKEVVCIDILYKESNSPNIYSVKTIKHGSEEWEESTTGGLMKGATVIETELIYATLPSNQLLRPWDNVPRKALAQEITGNRLVFANYLQNYNLKDNSGNPITIDISTSLKSTNPTVKEPEKSIKTLRTYQVGVVYRDVYGRETPVLASSQPSTVNSDLGETLGGLTVPKLQADKYNKLEAQVKSNAPAWAETYKFFIKETSNEYYNIAMDRWYNAEDGNIWISFPSKERNKIDIDTVLILKKQHDNDKFVDDSARYRVLAIDNEAPQFIKRKRSTFGSVVINFNSSGQPLEDRTQIFPVQNTFANSGLVEALGKTDVVMRIRNTGNKSNWYPVGGIAIANAGGYYIVTINGKFGPDMAFTDPDGDGTVISGLELELAQNTFENRPEFDGRFFVKIYKDLTLEENVVKVGNSIPDFAVKQVRHHYYLTNRKGRDDDWWSTAWERGDLFIDGEARGLAGFKTGIDAGPMGTFFGTSAYITQSEASSAGFSINSAYWNGNGGPFPKDDGYGLNSQLAGGTSTLPPIGPRTGNAAFPASKLNPNYCLELSVSGLKDGMQYQKVGAYNLGGVKTSNQIPFWDAISSVGTMFRWRNDPDGVVYVITEAVDSGKGGGGISSNINGNGILNFSDSNQPNIFDGFGGPKDEQDDNKTRRLYLTFRTSKDGWRKDSTLQHVDPLTGVTNTDPDKYIIDQNLTDQEPWWKGGSTPPQQFDPTRDYTGWTTSNAGTYPAAAGYIGQTNPSDTVTKQEIGNPGNAITTTILDNYTNTIEILDILWDEIEDTTSQNPGIWETEPKEDVGLDIYYEASQAYPLILDSTTNEMYAPYGSLVQNEGPQNGIPTAVFSTSPSVVSWNDNIVSLSQSASGVLFANDIISFTRPDGSVTRARVAITPTSTRVVLSKFVDKMKMTLPWFNCYSFGNGVESNRIRDDFNQVFIDKGPKASTTLAETYEEERRGTGLIYSGIYNSNSGINNLNQFIMAEPITKDLNPRFGTIQKLHSRDTDIVTCCEDKILKILANKDAVFNADGNVNLTATNRVLGQVIPFSGEYGISKNPESFAFQAYRSYFSDKSRGVVLRLSRDGLVPISQHGMKDFFADNLKNAFRIIGSYDDKKSLYNITLKCIKDATQSGSGAGAGSGTGAGGGTGTGVITTNNELTGLNTDGNLLGHWFRYGGVVDDWAKAIENGAFGQGFTDIGDIFNLFAGSGTTPAAIGDTQGNTGKGWTGIQAGGLHPAGVNWGKEGKYGLNPGLINPDVIIYFDDQTQPHPLAPSFDANPNFTDLINAFNIHGPGNVYLYQTFFQTNYAQYNPLLGCTGPFCLQGFSPWPQAWTNPHQPEAVYSIKNIEHEASSGSYKLTVNWLVGYGGFQDFQTFKWSLDSPFITASGGSGSCASNSVGTWDVNITYTPGTVVEYQGIYYVAQSTINGGLSPDNGFGATKWKLCVDSVGDNNDVGGGSAGQENNKGVRDYTVSFADKVNGWVSFKSWIQENGLSMNNRFYTFFGGNMWEHHTNNSRNNFYNATYPQISTIDVLLNEAPNVIKSIDYLKYSGSQAAITENISTANFDGEYYNNFAKLGWFASSIETDMQSGRKLEFKNKENKWFAYMQGEKTFFNTALDTNIDMQEFSFQGIGNVVTVSKDNITPPPPPPGPTRVILTIEDDPTDH